MGKKIKTGKQRQDKFYKLAKETGFRSRASFKLLQLNRKFEFLQKSRVLIDLCAAPGGWLQVAQQSMPVSSVIIGVDLVPIKPIPSVITIQEDITTDRCKQALKKHLKTWKVDTVIHDGAPNVGKNWLVDAFSQNQLVLSALKLATEFLVKGGCFVTKVFRSKDHLSLVWVFKKLFKKVSVTKPQASRSESAEIFVICQGYICPDHTDPRFLDPVHLFKDLDEKKESKANLLKIAKRRRAKAKGYDEDTITGKKLKVSEFIFNDGPIKMLGNSNEIIFDDDDIRQHKLTTDEIIDYCKDIQVLGKRELKILLKWHKQLRETILGAEANDIPNKQDISEEQEIDDALKEAESLQLSKLEEAKKKKKKILKERRKLLDRLNLNMIIKNDEPIIEEDREMFQLYKLRNAQQLMMFENDEPECDDDPSKKIENLGLYRSSYAEYNREDKEEDEYDTDDACEPRSFSDEEEEAEFEFESDDDDNQGEENVNELLDGEANPLMADLITKTEKVNYTISKWFDKPEFEDIPQDDTVELDLIEENFKKSKTIEDTVGNKGTNLTKKEKKPPKETTKKVKLDAEGLALGSLMVQSKKMKRDIVEAAYNRFAVTDEKLPDWFVKDEEKHYRKHLPVTVEQVDEYKERLKDINARPIKKVIQAKARKKRRTLKRLEKARKKAEVVTENCEMSEKEKAEHLKSIYKKLVPKKKDVTYVVAKKGIRARKPAGVKGRYKMVDRRMKKDMKNKKSQNLKRHTNKKKKHVR